MAMLRELTDIHVYEVPSGVRSVATLCVVATRHTLSALPLATAVHDMGERWSAQFLFLKSPDCTVQHRITVRTDV